MFSFLASSRAGLTSNQAIRGAVKLHPFTLPVAAARSLHSTPRQLQVAEAIATKRVEPEADDLSWQGSRIVVPLDKSESKKISSKSNVRSTLISEAVGTAQLSDSEAVGDLELYLSQEVKQASRIIPVIGSQVDEDPYWQNISRWKDISSDEFLSYRWQVSRITFWSKMPTTNSSSR